VYNQTLIEKDQLQKTCIVNLNHWFLYLWL